MAASACDEGAAVDAGLCLHSRCGGSCGSDGGCFCWLSEGGLGCFDRLAAARCGGRRESPFSACRDQDRDISWGWATCNESTHHACLWLCVRAERMQACWLEAGLLAGQQGKMLTDVHPFML